MASQTFSWFITGTSRGIGLEYVRQLTADENNVVIASCRNPDKAVELQGLKSKAKGQLHVVRLDVEDVSSFDAVKEEVEKIVGEKGLDYLINNAAINAGPDLAFDFKPQDLIDVITVNVISPALLARAFAPLLEKGQRKVIVNMTSGLGSIGIDAGSKNASYSISKCALNMLTYKQAKERKDFIPFVVDPGWVKTDMGGAGAFLEPHESVQPMIKFYTSVTPEHSGKFFSRSGEVIPW